MKQNIILVFGGQSPEHEVSVISARNIFNNIDNYLFNIFLIGVSRLGHFYHYNQKDFPEIDKVDTSENEHKKEVFFKKKKFNDDAQEYNIDIAFNVIHGNLGEDGAMQGFFKVYNIPYVGCDVLSSAICMDKEYSKIIAKAHQVPVCKFAIFYQENPFNYKKCMELVGLPFFMKPSSQGSSVGVYKIKSEVDYIAAMSKIFKYGSKIIIEEYIQGREVECAILGDSYGNVKIAETFGEIRPSKDHEFYNYEAKYLDANGAELIVPAIVNENIRVQLIQYSMAIFRALNCSGMARIDFLVRNEEVFLNEVNSLPGFTTISMYPRLWAESGIAYKDLITKLIQIGINRREMQLEGLHYQ